MKRVKIRRVHVESLMNSLHELYHRGVDFVDIEGKIEDGKDTIRLAFGIEYMDPEYANSFEEFDDIATKSEEPEEKEKEKIEIKKLTDEDLNRLL